MQSGMTMRMKLWSVVLWTVFAASPLCAQIRTIPRALRDSLANPSTARGAEAMQFDRTSADMGSMREDQTPSVAFRWTNTGDKPLVITRIGTTCGCVTADYDKKPVAAGQEAQVTVTYHPKGHPGGFSQRLFVYTQLSDKYPSAILSINGTVEAPGGPAAGFPVEMGALQLSRGTVTFDGKGGVQQANIACRNAGNTTLRVGYDQQLIPPGFSLQCDPKTLEPNAEGVLTIRYEPQADAAPLPERVPLFLTGLGLTPSRSTIRILIDNN